MSDSYFMQFIRDVLNDLKQYKESQIFNISQLDEIRKTYPNIKATKNELGYLIQL